MIFATRSRRPVGEGVAALVRLLLLGTMHNGIAVAASSYYLHMNTRSSLIRCAAAAVLAVAGCASKPAASAPDPVAAAKDQSLDVRERVASVDRIWAEGSGSPAARESLKSLAWTARTSSPVRVRALELLLADPADAQQADTRNMMRLMLPVEPDMGVIGFIARTAGERGWTDLAAPLVRSYSRRVATPPDAERPERAALLALSPGDSIERIVFRVFSAPAQGQGRDLERAEKGRAAAWALLSRLDADGTIRAGLLDGETATADPLIESLRVCRRDLGSVPFTASQLEWLTALRDTADPRNGAARKAWWAQTTAAIASLRADQRAKLALRHAEAIRFAAANRSDWMSMDRPALNALLRERLKGRPKASRGGGGDRENGVSDSFFDNEDKMSWADMLTLLVVDDAVHQPGVVKTLFPQSEQDRADTSTEYGGILIANDVAPASFVASLYPPRGTQRTGDTRFIASDDMLKDGATALAHYHFHVQRVVNGEFAGPGPGDAEYAIDQGRACVVFTSLREGVLNASSYHAGLTINLGEIARQP